MEHKFIGIDISKETFDVSFLGKNRKMGVLQVYKR